MSEPTAERIEKAAKIFWKAFNKHYGGTEESVCAGVLAAYPHLQPAPEPVSIADRDARWEKALRKEFDRWDSDHIETLLESCRLRLDNPTPTMQERVEAILDRAGMVDTKAQYAAEIDALYREGK